MTATCRLSADGRTIIVDLPIAFRRIGGRKQVILPDGGVFAPPTRRRIDGTMVKALARAFRWRKLLENGCYATVGDLASAEKINTSYVSRVLRLTLLVPDIVETIMDGRQPVAMTMADLLEPFPVEWPAQRAVPRGRQSQGLNQPNSRSTPPCRCAAVLCTKNVP